MEVTYTQKQKNFAAFMCAVIAAVMLLSSLYILMETDHDCTGHDCSICMSIQQCEDTLHLLSCGITAYKNTVTVILFFVSAILLSRSVNVVKPTLIAQRVRMND